MAELGRNLGLLALRLMAGVGIAILHGQTKVFAGGHAWIAQDATKLGLPLPPELMGWASSLAEFLGGILIALGLGTRPAALILLVNMSVAVFMHHGADALAPGSGKELALAYWTAALTLTLTGGGSFALDRFFRFKKKGK
jgi:putative oxidoreductase